jgi:hypothetical protein
MVLVLLYLDQDDEVEGSLPRGRVKWSFCSMKIERSADALRVRHNPHLFPSENRIPL